jgi:pilus assembly protein Flp/PilA
MRQLVFKLFVAFQDMKSSEAGQDLVEYALMLAMVSFGAVAGMSQLAAGVNDAFNTVSISLSADI